MKLKEVIDYYHELLTDEIAAQSDEQLRSRLLEHGLYFGKRPLCIVLRPHFYFEEDWNYMKSALENLLSAFYRMHQVCVSNEDYRAQLMLEPYEEELFHLDIGGPPPWTSSRLDMFYAIEAGSLKCVEYNAETPAGIGYSDALIEVFHGLEPIRRFQEHYALRGMPALGDLHESILRAYKQWGGKDKPQIGILDWSEVPTITEHEISKMFFEKNGTPAKLADPRTLEYHDGHLWAGDFRIDIIYKRVLYSELVSLMGTDNAILRAIRDRAVFITNSPSAKLLAKKASLAFLSDDKNAHLFSPAQQQTIQTHIPWTRVVREGKTTYHNQEVDLVPFIAEHRERFVLKPNDAYGGSGVVIGWECSAEGWESTLHEALATPHVVQERVEIVKRDYPVWVNNHLELTSMFVDADPYVFNGNTIYGCMTRLSPVSLLNVTAGLGSVVPSFIVHER